MKLVNGIVVALATLFNGVAFAQDAAVSAEKKAPLQQLLPGAHGSIEVRHSTLELRDTKAAKSDIMPFVELRPSLGASFYDGKLDSTFTWSFRKNPESVRFEKSQAGVINETTFTVFENENVKFFPYLYVEQGGAGASNFSYADFGPHVDLKKTFNTTAGEVTISGFLEPLAEFYSGSGAKRRGDALRARVQNSTNRDYTLTQTDVQEIAFEQKDPSLLNTTELAVRYVPSNNKNLGVSLGVDYLQSWSPKYKDVDPTAAISVEQDGYATSDLTVNKFTVSYKLSDKLVVANSARYFVAGAYEATNDRGQGGQGSNPRFENRLILSADLF